MNPPNHSQLFEALGRRLFEKVTSYVADGESTEWTEEVMELAEEIGLVRNVPYDYNVHAHIEPGEFVWDWSHLEREELKPHFTAETVRSAIDAEEELPGPMPPEMWDMIQSDKDATTELLRITVRKTKQGIIARLGLENALFTKPDGTPQTDLNQAGYLKMGATPNISTPPREVIEWLIEHQEGWYGPKASWSKKQQDDFSKHAGFLMLFLNRFPLSTQAK